MAFQNLVQALRYEHRFLCLNTTTTTITTTTKQAYITNQICCLPDLGGRDGVGQMAAISAGSNTNCKLSKQSQICFRFEATLSLTDCLPASLQKEKPYEYLYIYIFIFINANSIQTTNATILFIRSFRKSIYALNLAFIYNSFIYLLLLLLFC